MELNTDFGMHEFELADEVISPVREISAYEALWSEYTTVKKIADLFKEYSHALPSVVAQHVGITEDRLDAVLRSLRKIEPFKNYTALFHRDLEYPESLRSAKHPSEVLYYQGALDLLSSNIVSVVGSRHPSEDGLRRARKLAKLLVDENFTVMSGLAEGIDTAAHQAAIEAGGSTIAVVGTPLNEVYPKENKDLQSLISKNFLLISQVPFFYSSELNWRHKRFFFPERNKTMSALSRATIIVEAGETSGTLIQARAALAQGKQLFILNSCFEANLKWPSEFEKKGAIRVVDGKEIIEALKADGVAQNGI